MTDPPSDETKPTETTETTEPAETTQAPHDDGAQGDYLTWGEVLRVHQTLRNVRASTVADATAARSVLALLGPDVRYPSEWHGDDLWLSGETEGLEEGPDPANRGLVVAEVHGLPVRVFERVRPNRWRDRGYYRVTDHHSLVDRARGRRVMQFLLSPVGAAGAEMITVEIPRSALGMERPH